MDRPILHGSREIFGLQVLFGLDQCLMEGNLVLRGHVTTCMCLLCTFKTSIFIAISCTRCCTSHSDLVILGGLAPASISVGGIMKSAVNPREIWRLQPAEGLAAADIRYPVEPIIYIVLVVIAGAR